MKKRFLFFLFSGLIYGANLLAQSVLTLEECRRLAEENYPLTRQRELIDAAADFAVRNLTSVYFPQIQLVGQATYQTDITRLVLRPNIQQALNDFNNQWGNMLGVHLSTDSLMETMPKGQYKAYIEFTQLIWDGGQTAAGQKVARATGEVEKQKIAVSMYAIDQKINQLYFGILAIDEQAKILELYRADLQEMEKMVQSAVDNGAALRTDLNVVKVEFLNLDQRQIELTATRTACLSVLAAFIHRNLDKTTVLQTPSDFLMEKTAIQRPEIALFEHQRTLYNAQKQGVVAKNLPAFGFFVQGGYGRPALNMLNPNFQSYAIGGLQFRWNFGNLLNLKRDLKSIDNNLKMLDVQEETFRFNTQLEMNNLTPEIEKYQLMIQKDEEIVRLRSEIRQAAESKYHNGIIQMKDLIADSNAENIAKQTKSIHYIQYLQSLYELKLAGGK